MDITYQVLKPHLHIYLPTYLDCIYASKKTIKAVLLHTSIPKMERVAVISKILMLILMMVTVNGNEYEYDNALSYSYYHGSCPELERIIYNKVDEWFKNDSALAPALMRLHFHDCSVRGCDASVLLNHKGSERTAKASKYLRGFEIIDDIKAEVEKQCPKKVSCADILTAATRDATVAAGGPFWMVPYGRKDGKISIAKEAKYVPMGDEMITDLIEFFQSKGLNVLDLVVLSGAHTTGRLFNFKDQMLYTDWRTAPLVSAFASQSAIFKHQFAASMVKLGNIQDYLDNENGEIRVNCNYVNA